MGDFSHFNEAGRAKMVDVGGKAVTERVAVATGRILVNEETFEKIKTGGFKKGDVLGTAQIAAIMGAKKTSEIIPMCHPIMINGVDVNFQMIEEDLAIALTAEVKCGGVTGVEMEALTAV
ncbi:MAG: cyclic pyranopterin monophosphate synthase MoaC, partial [Anaerovoracaceae bacterium]